MTAHDPQDPHDLGEWDPSLLDAARALEGPSDALERRLLARLEGTIASEIAAPPRVDSVAERPSLGARVARVVRAHAAGVLVAFAAGVLTGRVTKSTDAPQSLTAPRSARDLALLRDAGASISEIAVIDVVVVSPADAAYGPAVGLEDASRGAPDVRTSAPRRPTARTPEPEDLTAETHLMDMARSALARGRAEAAMDAIDQHARAFAQGQLAEDRESLAVQALVTLGRREQATRRAEAFRRRWPSGLYRPRVEAAIALIR
ncbi:MAG: hypothetical protein Q8Q09_03845 [Deltaproteobacteria bacterium]|nr:hypothetical protein [Deltaproteobacteria bacterium]